MLFALISPAKRLDFRAAPLALKTSQPALLQETALLVARTKRYTRADLRRLMDISPALADLNFKRFQAFDPDNGGETKAAIYAFAGDVYMGFQAATLSKDDIAFAQKHVGILSGLYGLLRPLDVIQPYRLEMGSAVTTPRGKNLYDFWRAPLTAHLNAVLAKMKNVTVVNLASAEYWGAVDDKLLQVPVIAPAFHEIKNGKGAIVAFFAKKARGMMARYIVEHRIQDAEDLKAFDVAGYHFDAAASSATTWIFSRASTS